MPFLTKVRSLLRNTFTPHRGDSDLDDELCAHIAMLTEENIRSGMSEGEALRSAQLELGGLEQVKEAVRQRRLGNWLQSVLSDLRYAARQLRKNPGFTTVAILTLALGIGANTTIFQLLDAVRLRTLPVKAPQQLATVDFINHSKCCPGDTYSTRARFSSGLWNRIHEQQQAFSKIAAWSAMRHDLGQGGEARYADVLFVSGDFFDVLRVAPVLGHLISPDDDQRGCGAQAAVLSYSFWQSEYGARTAVLDDKISLNNHSFKIIGVSQPGFFGLEVGQKFDVAIPLCSQPVFASKMPLMDIPDAWWLNIVGRLQPGWTVERASAQLAAISPGVFAATLPPRYDTLARKDYLAARLVARPAGTGVSSLRMTYQDPLWLLLALSGLVLLIACANLANLMLARASIRQREMALRLTLGASRTRLVRQLLAESLLLASLGTLAGAVLALVLSPALVAFLSTQRDRVFIELSPDWRVLGFAATLAVLTCLLFGLLPALQSSRAELGLVLKSGGRVSTSGRERYLLRRVLVVSQIAFSLVLLVGAFLFLRTFHNLITLDTGFQQDHLLVAEFDFTPLKLSEQSQMAFRRELLARMRMLPTVSSAAAALIVPMTYRGWDNNIDIPDGPQRVDTNFNRVTSGYFATMQTPLLAGRDFNDTDTPTSPRVAIVNEIFARKFFGGANALGRVFYETENPHQPYQVIGLVRNAKYLDLREEPAPIAFLSFTQENGPDQAATIMIRSDAQLLPLVSSIKHEAAELNPAMTLNFTALRTQIREGLLRERLMATLSGFFGALATILAMVGLYGVISYMVIRRTNEIGVRVALGANRRNILGMILREAAVPVGIGLAAGAALALAAGTAASSLLYGLSPQDPLTLCAAMAGLAAVALFASLLPARRAAAMHPMAALREE
ncbi:MAG: ABC transporter permease [Candidatus Acidiferrum sp.]|jgi:predicted permease